MSLPVYVDNDDVARAAQGDLNLGAILAALATYHEEELDDVVDQLQELRAVNPGVRLALDRLGVPDRRPVA